MGEAYLRYSFTKGTAQEVDHIVRALRLSSGDRVLDVGCGPGRHAHELARRGIAVHGIDISDRFVEIARAEAPDGATFERLDARSLPFDGEFDAVICLCQGAFGLMTASGEDDVVVAGMARALRPGGRLALSAFSSYFVVKYHDEANVRRRHGGQPRAHRDSVRSGRTEDRRPLDRLLHPARAATPARHPRSSMSTRSAASSRARTARSAVNRVARVPRHRRRR